MFPDDFLDNDAFEDRDRVWRERFADPEREAKTLTILAERGDDLLGFAHSIIDEDENYGTLLDNLHVHPDAHRLGIGMRLMAETAGTLEAAGNTSSFYLWVLEDNAGARRFYEALGGNECGRGSVADGPSNPSLPAVPSLRICWAELDGLSNYLPAQRDPLVHPH
jgi:GNAT superfamily N-acetyltransferase